MIFYPSKNNNRLNGRVFQPDVITGQAMVNPHYPVLVDYRTKAICDSGAFQDDGTTKKRMRVTPEQALYRQLRLQERINAALDYHWFFEAIVTYDQMFGVDECVIDGKKVKKRGNEETARDAIKETLEAAAYYAANRDKIEGKICFACQGATPIQYLNECVLPIIDMMEDTDWLGFGGFCIIGRVPSLKPLFYETLETVLPIAKKRGIKRFHILGVTVADSIKIATGIARKYGVEISTDSSSIEVNSILGRVMNESNGSWKKIYAKEDKYVNYNPCDLSHENITRFNGWCNTLLEWNNENARAAYMEYEAAKTRQYRMAF